MQTWKAKTTDKPCRKRLPREAYKAQYVFLLLYGRTLPRYTAVFYILEYENMKSVSNFQYKEFFACLSLMQFSWLSAVFISNRNRH